jgi:hypothetical protein
MYIIRTMSKILSTFVFLGFLACGSNPRKSTILPEKQSEGLQAVDLEAMSFIWWTKAGLDSESLRQQISSLYSADVSVESQVRFNQGVLYRLKAEGKYFADHTSAGIDLLLASEIEQYFSSSKKDCLTTKAEVLKGTEFYMLHRLCTKNISAGMVNIKSKNLYKAPEFYNSYRRFKASQGDKIFVTGASFVDSEGIFSAPTLKIDYMSQ